MKENLKKQPEKKKHNPFLTEKFKLWVVAIIFSLICFHLYSIIAYPDTEIISSEMFLSIVLVLVGYIWMQELRDRNRLELLNKALIKTQEQLKHAEIDTITTLILTEEAKDHYVRGHSRRVAECALAIAQEMGFSEGRQKVVKRAGMLHDLGKIGIIDSILKKPDKLNDEEWKVMKEHPKRAIEILEPLKFLSAEKGIILHHHERLDGKGYPDGIKSDEIPLGARIMAVADTFDAMNSERAYRKPLPRNAIISELKKSSGSQLDPAIVEVFLRLLEKEPRLWKRD